MDDIQRHADETGEVITASITTKEESVLNTVQNCRMCLPQFTIRRPIKKHARSDYQIEWQSVNPHLKKLKIETVDFLSIPGDATNLSLGPVRVVSCLCFRVISWIILHRAEQKPIHEITRSNTKDAALAAGLDMRDAKHPADHLVVGMSTRLRRIA